MNIQPVKDKGLRRKNWPYISKTASRICSLAVGTFQRTEVRRIYLSGKKPDFGGFTCGEYEVELLLRLMLEPESDKAIWNSWDNEK